MLGGGNGSFAAAGDFALAGHRVSLWRRDAQAVTAHRSAGSRILVKDANGRHDVGLDLVTTDIARAVRDADVTAGRSAEAAQRSLNSTPPFALLSRELSTISTSTASAVEQRRRPLPDSSTQGDPEQGR